jgi:hypothetical protein
MMKNKRTKTAAGARSGSATRGTIAKIRSAPVRSIEVRVTRPGIQVDSADGPARIVGDFGHQTRSSSPVTEDRLVKLAAPSHVEWGGGNLLNP